MNGWGAIHLTIAPDGTALPCQEARLIETIDFPNVRDGDLAWIWREFAGVPEISRRFLDEGAVPQLRRKGKGFWRLPLPGLSADGRRSQYGSRSARNRRTASIIDDLLGCAKREKPDRVDRLVMRDIRKRQAPVDAGS